MVAERISGRQERKEEACDYKINFCLYCDPDQSPSLEEHNWAWMEAFSKVPRGQKIELQYEHRYDLGYWKALKNISAGKVDGVHAPSKSRDIASTDEQNRSWSLEETKRSMDMAAHLGAKYFVLHLTPQDDFQDRNGQLERGFKSLEELAKYYKDKGFAFEFLLETLEYPKWPADEKESEDVLERSQEVFKKYGISQKLGFCLDVGHLWHNLNSLLPEKSEFNFEDKLFQYMMAVSKIVPIEVIHLVGAYVDRGNHFDKNGKHETHAFPTSKPANFEGEWMEVNTVLKVVNRAGAILKKNPTITIEAHDPDISKHIKSCQQIKQQMGNI